MSSEPRSPPPEQLLSLSSSHHLQQPLGSRVRLRDYNLDVTSQRIQKPKQPIAGKAIEPSGKQCRDFRLGDAQHFSGLRLREPPALNDLLNSCCKLCLREILARVGNVDVGKHVSTAALNTIGWHVTFFRKGPCRHARQRPAWYGSTCIIPFLECKVNRRQIAVCKKCTGVHFLSRRQRPRPPSPAPEQLQREAEAGVEGDKVGAA